MYATIGENNRQQESRLGGRMSEKDRNITAAQDGGVFHGLGQQIKLILRLMGDRRVNPLLKLLPIGTLVYFFIPDFAPGPIDDALIIWLGTYLFVELCPADVVQEHRDELNRVVAGEWHDPIDEESDIIDAEYWEEE